MLTLWNRIIRKCVRLRLQPIDILVFHQVSDEWDSLRAWRCDWTQIQVLKNKIQAMQKKGVTFISLTEAYEHLKNDYIRLKKYAVLTSDDGYSSLKNVMPWLETKKVPITLFINTKYLDKKSWSPINEEQAKRVNPNVRMEDVVNGLYLSKEEVWSLTSPYITIGLHGHEHLDAAEMSQDSFAKNVDECQEILRSHPRYIPFYAYTWGHHTEQTDDYLRTRNLIPVLVNGQKNYTFNGYVDRECIDGK